MLIGVNLSSKEKTTLKRKTSIEKLKILHFTTSKHIKDYFRINYYLLYFTQAYYEVIRDFSVKLSIEFTLDEKIFIGGPWSDFRKD